MPVTAWLPGSSASKACWCAKGNPKGIADLRDLARAEVTFVNRQRGAGTRVLLDYHLGLLGIVPEQVQGLRSGGIHPPGGGGSGGFRTGPIVGMGVAAAARALDLDFIHLYDELYELIIPTEFYESPLLRPLLDWRKTLLSARL